MAARLDVWCGMEEPECLFAHGLFRRTGEAGPATASGGVRLLDGGLRPIPTTSPQPGPPVDRRARPCHETVSAPTLRRLASAPLDRNRSEETISFLG